MTAMRRLAWALLAFGGFVWHGCQAKGAAVEDAGALCRAGENIFCLCDDGGAGVKKCNDDGMSFGECSHCKPRPNSGSGATSGPTSATVSTSVHASSSSGTSGSGGASTTGTSVTSTGTGGSLMKGVAEPCRTGDECKTGNCAYGYCTMPCKDVTECWPFDAECVAFDGDQLCMPTCKTKVDCEPYLAPPSKCGWTKAIDGWGVTVCTDWGNQHQLVPVGKGCTPKQHVDCNLGYLHELHVCNAQGLCALGCYTKDDCPLNQSCSLMADPGTCK
jgi:hypothetical protein